MENTLTVALARQSVLARQMDVIATNLANLETAGFKSENMIFSEIIEETSEGEFLSIVHDVSFFRDVGEGPLVGTSAPLDLAVHGEGYFAVETTEGERYTRHGNFQLDDTGRIVTSDGHAVLNSGGAPIVIPPDAGDITVTRDGTVSANDAPIGQLKLVRFDDEQLLTKLGNGLYDAAGLPPLPATDSQVLQGMIEKSNVNGVVEITRMIDTVRSYEAAAKLADTEHQRILDAIEALMTSA